MFGIEDIGNLYKKNEYENAQRNLLNYKAELEEILEEIKSNVEGFKTVYSEQANFKGEVCNNYLKKSENNYEEMLSIIRELEMKIVTISDSANQAGKLAESYNDK